MCSLKLQLRPAPPGSAPSSHTGGLSMVMTPTPSGRTLIVAGMAAAKRYWDATGELKALKELEPKGPMMNMQHAGK